VEVAVPPAPDGKAVGDPSDSTDTTPSDTPSDATGLTARTRRTILVSAVGVIAVCLVFSVLFAVVRDGSPKVIYDDPADNPQSQRDQVMAVARSFVTQFSSYGPDDLDEQQKMPEYVERVEKFLTPKFVTTFESSVTFAEQTVAQQQATRLGEVYAVAVSRLDEDSARVLVAGRDSISVPNPKKPDELVPYSDQPFRYEIDLVLTEGEWLVDNFGVVGTLDGDLPEDAPTEAPTSEQSSPGGGDQE
jgi:Mce-associated membrane protein